MKSKTVVLLVILGMVFSAAWVVANQEMGAEDITINGGTRGNIPFPHRKHQDNLKDCHICHDSFPQTPGAIDDYKSQGKLEKKQVMNKLCTKCHKAVKREGKKTGPTTCMKCHIK